MRTLRFPFASFAVKDLNRKGRKVAAKIRKGLYSLQSACSPSPVCMAEKPVRQEQIDHIFEGLKSDRTPGAAVLVIKDGKIVFERGYGVADLHSRRKIDASHKFPAGIVHQAIHSHGVMLLVHDGKLHYEDRLTDIFPDFPAYGKSITIRNLLNHTSGLLDYEDLMAKPAPGTAPDEIPQIKDAGVLELLKQQKTTKFPPGTKLGLQQLRLCGAGYGGRKSFRTAFRRFSSRPDFRPSRHEAHRGLRKRQEHVLPIAPMATPMRGERGASRIRVRLRRYWATAAFIPHSTI